MLSACVGGTAGRPAMGARAMGTNQMSEPETYPWRWDVPMDAATFRRVLGGESAARGWCATRVLSRAPSAPTASGVSQTHPRPLGTGNPTIEVVGHPFMEAPSHPFKGHTLGIHTLSLPVSTTTKQIHAK